MSDVVFVRVAFVVIPTDFALVARHRTVKMLERVCVSFRLCSDQKRGRKHQYELDELTRNVLISVNQIIICELNSIGYAIGLRGDKMLERTLRLKLIEREHSQKRT